MDNAQADNLYSTVGVNAMRKRVGERGGCGSALDVLVGASHLRQRSEKKSASLCLRF